MCFLFYQICNETSISKIKTLLALNGILIKKKWNYLIGDVVKLCYSKINSTSIATFTFIDKTTLKIFN